MGVTYITNGGDEKCIQNCGRKNLKGRNFWDDVDSRIILNRILERQTGKVWIGFIWLRTGSVAGFCDQGNDPLVSIKDREFLD
jgi:hypothetical protein